MILLSGIINQDISACQLLKNDHINEINWESDSIHAQHLAQCVNCSFGKKIRGPFKRTEELPETIGDIASSDVCSLFKASIGGYKYFITLINHKS